MIIISNDPSFLYIEGFAHLAFRLSSTSPRAIHIAELGTCVN